MIDGRSAPPRQGHAPAQVLMPVAVLMAGVALLVLRSHLPITALQDLLQALSYGMFTLGAFDLAEQAFKGCKRRFWA